MTYANGTTVTYYCDSLDRIAKVCYNENEPSEQEYMLGGVKRTGFNYDPHIVQNIAHYYWQTFN